LLRARNAALALAILVGAAGWFFNSKAAGGADSYGYVSQADLVRHGTLTIDQSFTRDVPWPLAADTFSPLGYRPSADGARLVPIYSPGLPMLMADAQIVGGRSAAFWIVPLAGAVLVLATFALAESPVVGLTAAAIVATSPTFLYMLFQPMSDVPAAAAWAVALACVLAGTSIAPVGAGVATSVAILIRPNLAPLAIVIAAAALLRSRRALLPLVVFGAIGPAIIAVIDARYHGSVLSSGYDLTDAFSLGYVVTNVERYGWWLLTAEPVLVVGFVALAANLRRLWPLAAVVAVVAASYLVYVPFDVWWFLRYWLPAWSMLAVGAAIVLTRAGRALVPIVLVVAVLGVWQAEQRGAFDIARAEAKYPDVGQIVRTTTAPRDVMISVQHSGSLRYYADRLTLRWDFMDPLWLDRAVEWLSARGQHAYLVLDRDEVLSVRARFAAASVVGRLDWPPIVSYEDGVTVVYDAVARDPHTRTLTVRSRRSSRAAP
jgi:hypothetical protein